MLYGKFGELLAEFPPDEARDLVAALVRLEHVDT